MQERQNKASTELKLKLGLINHIVEELRLDGVAEEVAILATFSAMRNRMEQFFVGPNGNFSIEKCADTTDQILTNLKRFRTLASTGAAVTAAATSGLENVARSTASGVTSLATKIGRLTANELQNVRQVLQSAGQGATSTTTKIALKGLGAVTGVIFSAVDIAFLIKEWKTPHPLIEQIETVVYVLLKDVDQCDDMVSVIRLLESSSPELPAVSI